VKWGFNARATVYQSVQRQLSSSPCLDLRLLLYQLIIFIFLMFESTLFSTLTHSLQHGVIGVSNTIVILFCAASSEGMSDLLSYMEMAENATQQTAEF